MKSLVKVFIRIIALYFGVKSIIFVNDLIYLYGVTTGILFDHSVSDLGYILYKIILHLIVGTCLWVFNNRITELIIRDDNSDVNCRINISYRELLNIVWKIFGLVLIVISIEPLLNEVIRILAMKDFLSMIQHKYFYLALLAPILKIIIGYILVFRSPNENNPSDL